MSENAKFRTSGTLRSDGDSVMLEMDSEMELLLRELREMVIAKHLEEPNADTGGCIYHYTTSHGLLGILSSGTVWTTNVHCLNDPHEIDYGLSICREFLENLTPANRNHDVLREASKEILENFTDILAPSPYQFVTSFSLEGDLLSQWRAYADGGGGYAIGFDAMGILSHLGIDDNDLNFGTRPGYMPAYLIYERVEQMAMLRAIFDAVVSFVDRIGRAGRLNEYEPEEVAVVVAYAISRAALFFKSNFFKEEREMRLLVSNVQEMASAKTPISAEVRASPDGRLITYRPLSLKDASGLLPIREIVVGPKADFETARRGIEALLRSRGYEERMPEIRKSAGALR